ncbi:MAG: hypothetical protein LBR75_05470 [Prevotellaceae bacterium]|jgi:tetratricopeptide (TPR) repeat protein|nr:hypothetical protein [Prevotellaceae bacterium]
MKKTILIGMMAFGAFALFAQKSNVNKAMTYIYMEETLKSAEINAAKELITPALEDPTTMNDAKTWYVAGMVANKEYDAEYVKSMRGQTDDNEAKKGRVVMAAVDYFAKADELDSRPDAKGKVKHKYREEIKPYVKNYRNVLINYGIYSYNKNDMRNAIRAFEKFLEIPALPMMQGDVSVTQDSTILIIREYLDDAIILQAKNNLAEKKDTAAYYKAIKAAFDKNPESKRLINSMLDYYSIMKNDPEKALEFVDKAIALQPDNVIYYTIKGQLLSRLGRTDDALAVFQKVAELEPNNTEAYIGMASIFTAAGDRLGEEANAIKENAAYEAKMAERKAMFTKAIPYLEKVRQLDSQDTQNLRILQQVYYIVEGDSENYQRISAELKAFQ